MVHQKTRVKKLLKITLADIIAICSRSLKMPTAVAAPRQIIDQRDHEKYQTFTGKVVWVECQQFDLRVDGGTY